MKAVYENPDGESMISTILSNKKLPAKEKELDRLDNELHFLIFAATDAPSQVMAITLFHLLWNPETYQKLKDELDEAFPVLSDADWTKLKSLPYLVSIINPAMFSYIILTMTLQVCCGERRSTDFGRCDIKASAYCTR